MPGMTDRDHFAAAAYDEAAARLLYERDSANDELSLLRRAVRQLLDGVNERHPEKPPREWVCNDMALLDRLVPPNHDAAPAAIAGTPGTGDTQSFDAYRRFVGEVMNWISEATSAADWSSDGGRKIMADACSRCWDAFDRIAPTDHGASPEAIAESDEDRADKAATSHRRDGTGDTPKPINDCVSDRSKPINGPDPDSRVWETPVHTPAPHATPSVGSVPRECTEPVAWGVASHFRVLATSISRMDAVDMQSEHECDTEVVPLYRHPPVTEPMPTEKRAEVCAGPPAWAAIRENGQPLWLSYDRSGAEGMVNGMAEVVPLYRSPTLTDAEREAIAGAIESEHGRGAWQWADALHGLLERLK